MEKYIVATLALTSLSRCAVAVAMSEVTSCRSDVTSLCKSIGSWWCEAGVGFEGGVVCWNGVAVAVAVADGSRPGPRSRELLAFSSSEIGRAWKRTLQHAGVRTGVCVRCNQKVSAASAFP